MSQRKKVSDVFVPGSYPKFTFVDRSMDGETLTSRVQDALDLQGMMVGLIGPSKSGKTQLLRRALGDRHYIRISCAGFKTVEQILDNLAQNLGMPRQRQESSQSENTNAAQVSGKGGGSILGVSAEAQAQYSGQRKRGAGETFIYGTPSINEIEKVIKIPLDNWTPQDLAKIAELGFAALNLDAGTAWCRKLGDEACFSPQVMQQLCFDFCRVHELNEEHEALHAFAPDHDKLRVALRRTAQSIHFDTILQTFSEGKLERKAEKTQFTFQDGSKGSFYKCLVLLLAMDPPMTRFSRAELATRLRRVAAAGVKRPGIASIVRAAQYLEEKANEWAHDQMSANIKQFVGIEEAETNRTITKEEIEKMLVDSQAVWEEKAKELYLSDPSFLYIIRNSVR